MTAKSASYKPDARTEVIRLRRALDELITRIEAVHPEEELSGDLNRYLCVRVCGFLEQALLVLARSACQQGSWGNASAFGLSWLARAPNPSARDVRRLVERFSCTWAEEFDEFLADEERRSRMNALVGLRNDIAHGKNQGVSARQVGDYYNLANQVVDWLTERLDPRP